MTEDEKFVAEFEACRWPLEQWHHKEHIKLAYLYLRRHPFDEAMAKMREALKKYIVFHGVPDEPMRGYHETMTQGWMRLVYFTMCEYGPAESAEAFYERSPQLSQKKALRLFYSAELCAAARGKTEYVEPDLTAFPRSRKKMPPLI